MVEHGGIEGIDVAGFLQDVVERVGTEGAETHGQGSGGGGGGTEEAMFHGGKLIGPSGGGEGSFSRIPGPSPVAGRPWPGPGAVPGL